MDSKKRDGGSSAVAVMGTLQAERLQNAANKNLEILRRRAARRLDKVEREIGYCEIKIEKERRLEKKLGFLRVVLAALDKHIDEYAPRGQTLSLSGRALPSDGTRRPTRKGFLAAGLIEILEEERDILTRERDEMIDRLASYDGFEKKLDLLQEEKRDAFKQLSPVYPPKMRRLNDDFVKIERQWNSLNEDLSNLEEGTFFLDRNLDYLKSCRAFLISAKGSFDIESWVAGGYLSDLFRHSSIGRAKEMADGADRNLKMALKELVCLTSVKVPAEDFERVLSPVLEALYQDIYSDGRIDSSLLVIEAALAKNLKLVEQVKVKREALRAKLSEIEKQRAQLFARLESDRRGLE